MTRDSLVGVATLVALLPLAACGTKPAGDRPAAPHSGDPTADEDAPAGDSGAPAETGPVDRDGDGVPAEQDCDDTDPAVSPAVEEQPYNGVDDDCDPATPDDDLDGDGHGIATDCDDADPSVHPGATELAGDGRDNDCNPTTCVGTGFSETPVRWTLPEDGWVTGPDGLDSPSGGRDCEDETSPPRIETVDLTGDGALDLVVTSTCQDGDTVGEDHWLVYPGTGAGFAATPLRWELPEDGWRNRPDGFAGLSAVGGCSTSSQPPQYRVVELTGDRAPELVVTSTCDPDDTVGQDHWLVYPGSATGFAPAPLVWTLPEDGWVSQPDDFRTTWGIAHCTDTTRAPSFSTSTDHTGDGAPDLIVTQSCQDETVGEDHWLVYPNTGTGFAATPQRWTLPATTHGACEGDEGTLRALTLDPTGDGWPDLVVFTTCQDGDTVGQDHWLVYPGSAAGFAATPVSWALPTDRWTPTPDHFGSVAAFADCPDQTAPPTAVSTDLNGDGQTDLVVTHTCATDDTVGQDHWLLYPGDGTGFAPTPAVWPLPAADWDVPPGFFSQLSGGVLCTDAPTPRRYLSMDLTGAGGLQLLVTSTCDPADAVGEDHWLVFPASCDL